MSAAGTVRPEISVRAVSTLALYFESVHGRAKLEEAYAQVPGAPPLSFIFEPNNYISFDLTVARTTAGDSGFHDHQSERSGEASALTKILLISSNSAVAWRRSTSC